MGSAHSMTVTNFSASTIHLVPSRVPQGYAHAMTLCTPRCPQAPLFTGSQALLPTLAVSMTPLVWELIVMKISTKLLPFFSVPFVT